MMHDDDNADSDLGWENATFDRLAGFDDAEDERPHPDDIDPTEPEELRDMGL